MQELRNYIKIVIVDVKSSLYFLSFNCFLLIKVAIK